MKNRNLFRLSLMTLALSAAYSVHAQEQSTELHEVKVKQEKSDEEDSTSKNDSKNIEHIEVTGSRIIKDPKLTTRTITSIDRDYINKSGVGTLDELLRKLPQNINSVSNTGSGFNINNSSFGLGPNLYASSSVNLRGLGAAYTLILIDGRRPAKGGMFGDITDISTIPLERIARIEILFDGAAAIYGSDAVGGVINIITNRDYEGTEVSVSIDGTTKGGGESKKIDIGHTWDLDKASFTAFGSYSKRDAIDSRERALDYSGLLKHDLPPNLPGSIGNSIAGNEIMWVKDINGDGDYNDAELGERLTGGVLFEVTSWGEVSPSYARRGKGVAGVDPATSPMMTQEQIAWVESLEDPVAQGYSPVYYARLPEYKGTAMSLYDVPYTLKAGASAEEQFAALGGTTVEGVGQSLTPEVIQYNTGFDFDYQFNSDVTFRLSSDISRIRSESVMRPAGETLNVGFDALSSPFGVPLNYSVLNGLPQERNNVTTDTIDVKSTVEWQFHKDWFLQFNTSHNKQDSKSEFVNTIYTPANSFSAEDFAAIKDNYAGSLQGRLNGSDFISIKTPAGGFTDYSSYVHENVHFHDPYLGFGSAEALAAAVINPYYRTFTNTASSEIELFMQGNLMELPGGTLTTSVVASHRGEKVDLVNNNTLISLRTVLPGVNQSVLDQEFDAKTNGVGTEISIPVIGAKNQLWAVDNFAIHAAARIEDTNYMDKKASNTSLGFNYQPIDSVTLRVNQSKNTKLPSPHLILGDTVTSAPTTTLYDCSTGSCRPYSSDFNVWKIEGAADDLKPEKNENTQVSILYNPLDKLQFNLGYSKNLTEQQIDVSGNGGFVTAEMIQQANSTPFFYRVDENTIIGGTPFAGRELTQWGTTYIAQVGDFILDQRNYNIKSTDVRSVDFGMKWSYDALEYGDFYLTWSHTHALQHEIIQNSVCTSNSENCSFYGWEYGSAVAEPIDIVNVIDKRLQLTSLLNMQAVPENAGFVQLDWQLNELSVGLSTRYQSSTITRNEKRTFVYPATLKHEYDIKTTPSLSLDLNVSYAFQQSSWAHQYPVLKSSTVYFTMNGIVRRDQKVEAILKDPDYDYGDSLEAFNYSAYDPRGRSWSLRLRTTF